MNAIQLLSKTPVALNSAMKCHVCGATLVAEKSDMPFKINQHKVVILKELPFLACHDCGEYLMDDSVMAQVEWMIGHTVPEAELDVLRFSPAVEMPTHGGVA